ncbi:MAG: hypothetical protein HN352_16825, partial [Bacteroidetes bacterium]|nr:hypothetical protein [Bacteroidota bacterium]
MENELGKRINPFSLLTLDADKELVFKVLFMLFDTPHDLYYNDANPIWSYEDTMNGNSWNAGSIRDGLNFVLSDITFNPETDKNTLKRLIILSSHLKEKVEESADFWEIKSDCILQISKEFESNPDQFYSGKKTVEEMQPEEFRLLSLKELDSYEAYVAFNTDIIFARLCQFNTYCGVGIICSENLGNFIADLNTYL